MAPPFIPTAWRSTCSTRAAPFKGAQGVLQAIAPSKPRPSYAPPSTLATGNEAGIGKTGLAIRLLAETAATLGITRPTAKTHLEHIFLKTGVTRQAELMRLWTGLISPTRSKL
jgi:hypothetical protein